jgi:hypothetical protein
VSKLRAERPGLSIRGLERDFSLHSHVETGSGGPQLPIQWVLEAISMLLMRPVREACHLPPTSSSVRD